MVSPNIHDTRRSKRQFSVKTTAASPIPPAKHPRLESMSRSHLAGSKVSGGTNIEYLNVDFAAYDMISYSWPNQPISLGRSREVYESIAISLKSPRQATSFTARRGDTLRVMTERGKQVFCRVNQFVKLSKASSHGMDECDVTIEGNWLLHRTDVDNLLGDSVTPDCQTFLNELKDNELILTKKLAIQDISRIVGKIRVLFLLPNLAMPASLPRGEIFCRYSLEINAHNKKLEWVKLDTKQIDLKTVENSDDFDDDVTGDSDEMLSSPSNDGHSTTLVEETSKVTLQEGGGATLRTEIRVGSNYQADVKPFVPGRVVQSRMPVLVFKANAISDSDLYHFLNRVADLHNEYLQNNLISLEEPYTPLSHARAEDEMRATARFQRLTGSSMSTSSMLAGKPCRLQRECNADAVLELLSLQNYDTAATFDAIQSDVCRITSGWTKSERELFDLSFRQNAGSLRATANVMSPKKAMKEAIDYFYRFKVSDQFRKFQDKKRTFAVQMVECIEKRKHLESISSNHTLGLPGTIVGSAYQPSHWSGRSTTSVAVVADDRVRSAKQLLLDVKETYGIKRLVDVISVIRQLQECYDVESKSYLFKLLDDHPELQKRFLDFLPQHF
jgi:hypothetical protein